jgi:hypothetical protein
VLRKPEKKHIKHDTIPEIFTTMGMRNTDLRHDAVLLTTLSEELAACVFKPEDGGSTFLLNDLPDYTTSY